LGKRDKLLGILPERRKDPIRITPNPLWIGEESWVKVLVLMSTVFTLFK